MKTINVPLAASVNGLRERLEDEAGRRGLNLRKLVGNIYSYAVKNKRLFQHPLANPRAKGGRHIGATVSDQVERELTKWAKEKETKRGNHCRYLLEIALEDDLIDKILETPS
jgi:hypothetical protein